MRKWSYLRIRIQGPCYHPDQIIRFKIDMISNINVYATACHCLALSWSSLPPASSELQLSSSRSIESDSDREWQHSQPSFSIDFGCNHVWPQEEIENLRNHNVQTASCKSLDTAAGWQWPKSCIAPKNTQLAADIWQNCLDKESEVGGEDWIGRRWLCLASQRLSWKRLGRCGIGSSSKVPQLNNFELVGRSIPPPFPHREDHLSLIMKSSHMNKIFPESSCFQLWTRMTCLLWRWIKSHSIPRRLIIEGGASQRQPTETLTHGVMS